MESSFLMKSIFPKQAMAMMMLLIKRTMKECTVTRIILKLCLIKKTLKEITVKTIILKLCLTSLMNLTHTLVRTQYLRITRLQKKQESMSVEAIGTELSLIVPIPNVEFVAGLSKTSRVSENTYCHISDPRSGRSWRGSAPPGSVIFATRS